MNEMNARICSSGSFTLTILPDGKKVRNKKEIGATIEKEGKELECPTLLKYQYILSKSNSI